MNYEDGLKTLVENNRLKYFTPTGIQEEFIRAVGSNDNFIIVFSAANAAGKTALMANILGACIFGQSENLYFNYSLFLNFPFIHRARIASTSKNIEEIGAIQTEIKKWWPKNKFESRKNGKHFDSEFISGDWVIDVMSYEQEVKEFESATLGICIFDEPPPVKILNATIARMRQGGMILIFMTPLDTGGEILEDLSEKESVFCEGKEIGKVKIVFADIESSCRQHGVRGFLEHSNIEQMMNFYDPDEKDARAKGKPVHLTGRIYPEFEVDNPHVVDDFFIPDDWTRVQVIDPHDGIPFAITWAAIDPIGEVWIYDEFPLEDLEKINSTSLTIPDYSRIIRDREGRDKIHLRILDPYYGNQRYSNTGKTIKQELFDFGFDFVDGDTSGLDLGHKKVREYLRYQKDLPVSSLNHSRLHILKRCRNHWRSLSRYKRKILKSGEVKDKIIIDETYKHFCDNLRHLLMRNDLQYLQRDKNNSSISYRVVGDMKDVRFEEEDDNDNYNRYLNKTRMPA